MPIFDTPEPILVTIELGIGDVHITASDRIDTVVETRPSDDSDQSDVQSAKQTHVEYANGTLTVKAPKPGVLDFSRKSRSVDVSIELPTGSQVHATTIGDIRCTGQLGECGVKTSAGHVQLDRTGPLRVDTAAGHVTVGGVVGKAEITTGSGKVRVGEIDGMGVIKNSNGNTDIGTVTGEVHVHAANGDISIDHALGSRAEVKTANGSIRIGEAARGSVVLKTAMGDLNVGIAEGTAAWLDVNTGFGRVHNSLSDASQGPEQHDDTLEVRARTSYGDITIARS